MLIGGWDGRLLEEPTGNGSSEQNDPAQGIKEGEIPQAFDQNSGSHQGNDLGDEEADVQDALHPAALACGGDIGGPGIEGGVVGGGAEEGHDRIGDDHHDDRETGDLDIGNRGEEDGGQAPADVAEEDVGAAAAPFGTGAV